MQIGVGKGLKVVSWPGHLEESEMENLEMCKSRTEGMSETIFEEKKD